MSVVSLGEYVDIVKDRQENFHGNQLVYIGWDRHVMFCSAAAFPLPPEMPFGALIKEVIPGQYSPHPDYKEINWDTVQWLLDGEPFVPEMEKSLQESGVKHKSLIRFITPELTGIKGSGS